MTGLYPVYLGTVIREKEADTRVFFVSRRLVKRGRWLVKSNDITDIPMRLHILRVTRHFSRINERNTILKRFRCFPVYKNLM